MLHAGQSVAKKLMITGFLPRTLASASFPPSIVGRVKSGTGTFFRVVSSTEADGAALASGEGALVGEAAGTA